MSASANAAAPSGTHGNLFTGFAPWIVFDVVASPSTWELAALAALLTSLILARPDFRASRLKLLDIIGVAFFLLLVVLGILLDRRDLDWLERYAQVISSGVIALVALGSLLLSAPFTEQYARETTPREYWGSPTFKRINRVLTAVWAVVFVITALLGWIALNVDSGQDWLNWVVPVALVVGALKFTAWYPEHAS